VKDKTVVITGATSGIGGVAALTLAKMGARIVVVARNKQRGDATLASPQQHARYRSHSTSCRSFTIGPTGLTSRPAARNGSFVTLSRQLSRSQ
jgi:NAD(P)-dependent dehydrogenase (short-subunit alcohol dehydrogenase family)